MTCSTITQYLFFKVTTQTEVGIIRIISIPWAAKRCSWKKCLHDLKKKNNNKNLKNAATLTFFSESRISVNKSI